MKGLIAWILAGLLSLSLVHMAGDKKPMGLVTTSFVVALGPLSLLIIGVMVGCSALEKICVMDCGGSK